jgi:hypothetical protein
MHGSIRPLLDSQTAQANAILRIVARASSTYRNLSKAALRSRTAILIAFLMGCHATLTPAAQLVQIEKNVPGGCVFIDDLEVTCCQIGHLRDMHQTKIILQNAAAEMGANRVSEMRIAESTIHTGAGPVPLFFGSGRAWDCP